MDMANTYFGLNSLWIWHWITLIHKKTNTPFYISTVSTRKGEICSLVHILTAWICPTLDLLGLMHQCPCAAITLECSQSRIYLIKCQFQAWFIPVDCLYAHVLITSHPLKQFQPTSEDLSGHWVVGTAPASCRRLSGIASRLFSAATTFPWVGMLLGEARWVGWYER